MICNKMNTFTKTVDIDYSINKLQWEGEKKFTVLSMRITTLVIHCVLITRSDEAHLGITL